MITLVDYGLGNIRAFENIYRRLGIPCTIASDPKALTLSDRIILPGVGSFDWAMQRLGAAGFHPVLDDLARNRNCAILGVCVGMQIMARRSEEGVLPGFGWFDADVVRFRPTIGGEKVYLPHMGWNDVKPRSSGGLFKGLHAPRYYFLHSYYFRCDSTADTEGTTEYHEVFTSAAHKGRLFGVQFHPEKSHDWGVELLRNFAQL